MVRRDQWNGMVPALYLNMETTNITTLRGLGRYAYRMGLTLSQAYDHARKHVGFLGTLECRAVAAGWSAERAEAV